MAIVMTVPKNRIVLLTAGGLQLCCQLWFTVNIKGVWVISIKVHNFVPNDLPWWLGVRCEEGLDHPKILKPYISTAFKILERHSTYLKSNFQMGNLLDEQKDIIFVTLTIAKGFEWDQSEGPKCQGHFPLTFIRDLILWSEKMPWRLGPSNWSHPNCSGIRVTKITSIWSSNDMSGWVLYFRHVTYHARL